jgi:nicotinate-nucleotide--dimethylbenzimidazole phosphoribosyltransferase
MGIGNTTAAAAICHALYGETADVWTGPGTGVEGDALANKIRVVSDSVVLHKHLMTDGLEILRCVGGRELAAIAGAIISARYLKVPAIIDGFIATAAAAVLESVRPGALDHCLVAHTSAEPGHRKLLERIGKEPLVDLGMRLGEGSGAALVIGMIKAAAQCHSGMATFAEAAVAGKTEA